MKAASIASGLSQAHIDGAIVDGNHADYDKYRKIWNGVADRRPAAIVRARNVEDVLKTVRVAADLFLDPSEVQDALVFNHRHRLSRGDSGALYELG